MVGPLCIRARPVHDMLGPFRIRARLTPACSNLSASGVTHPGQLRLNAAFRFPATDRPSGVTHPRSAPLHSGPSSPGLPSTFGHHASPDQPASSRSVAFRPPFGLRSSSTRPFVARSSPPGRWPAGASGKTRLHRRAARSSCWQDTRRRQEHAAAESVPTERSIITLLASPRLLVVSHFRGNGNASGNLEPASAGLEEILRLHS